MFVALEHWVRDGVDPPASRVPRVDDGTATTRDEVLARFRAIPGIATPDGDALPTADAVDLGADAGFGVVSHPMGHGPPYPNHVAAVDDDGNEVAGIRVPMVSVPVATYTGWNVRPAVDGLPALMPDFLGSRLPFTATRADREALADPRPATAERYADRDDYEERVCAAATSLVAERLLLADDVDDVVAAAVREYPPRRADTVLAGN